MPAVCPTCSRPLPLIATPERPLPLSDPRAELVVRIVMETGECTVSECARQLFGVPAPSAAHREQARRLLTLAVSQGALRCTNRPNGHRPVAVFTPSPVPASG